MKKLFAFTVILALIFVACNDGNENQENVASLEIKNESNIEISEVIWNNVTFVYSQNSIKPGSSVTKDVAPGTGYIYFKKKGHPIAVRTNDLVTVDNKEQKEFLFINNTVITEIGSTNTKDTLNAFYAKPWILIKQNNAAINQYGEFDFGSISKNENKNIAFTIENIGGANLIFDTADGNYVNINDNTSGYFSVIQQPLVSSLLPGASISFTIRFNPEAVGDNFSAVVKINTNSYNAEEFFFRIKGSGRNFATVNAAAIAGVTVPSPGVIPSATISENAQYSGTVTWSPALSGPFILSTVYTATISLTAKAGYTLQGVPANFFTVVGAASVSNSANSGVVTAVFPATRYKIGDTGPGGGKIFYYNAAGFTVTREVCYYLEAAPNDMSTLLAWASSTSLSMDTGMKTLIGAGRNNTALILSASANAPAAKACNNYRGPNNLTDWFLPSKDELNELYKNRALVGNLDTNTGLYWSSSSSSSTERIISPPSTVSESWFQHFGNGSQTVIAITNRYSVRPIRAF